jgi:hypothetical protein
MVQAVRDALAEPALAHGALDSRNGKLLWRYPSGLHYSQKVMRTVEAVIDCDGKVRLLEPLHPGATCRALVVIFDDEEDARADGARLSEAALAQDWTRPEEDDAWAPLQPAT